MPFIQPLRPAQGNVLFIILIAVVLFAALSYAISLSTRQNQKDAGAEKIEVTAAALMQFATSVENAVTRVRVSNACPETDISFGTPIYTDMGGTIYNPDSKYSTSPPNRRCHVFDSNGGQAIAISFEQAAILGQVAGPLRSGHATLLIANVPGIGSSNPDLVLAFPSIRREICIAAQRKASGGTSEVGNCTWTDYTGNFSSSPTCDAGISGKWTWCGIDAANSESANFYHVVMPR